MAWRLDESLKSFLLRFANGAYFRRPFPGTQITADFASPHGQREGRNAASLGFGLGLFPLFVWRAPLGNGL
jgi:hypothetical protein